MLTRLRNLFLQGIALLAPLALTIALLVWLGEWVESVVGGALRHLLPAGWYIPGLGLAAGVLLTLAAGLLANLFLVRWLLDLLGRLLDRIPLVKSLFRGLKDISRFFGQSRGEMGRPVSVRLPLGDGEVQLVGFVMQEHATLPGAQDAAAGADDAAEAEDAAAERCVAVYLPMSYQVGGYTLYLDRARISPLDVSPEEALRSVLTGGALAEQDEDRPSRRRKAAGSQQGGGQRSRGSAGATPAAERR
ncbi:MAG: DUF502 domain-containing protein [Thiohalocapsa sp.]|uniref:DUF502 domain-containing protein n=1 Tax=Thiohalocapsa sp. TaxID=2497641 RepID=UPI0025EE0D92|nr:DUF502 domain-containing protein [Thiohalocapsa sp.]MCG6943510.1 DUF502 domain-containing protein [Thiohalocapsa sp.]